VEHGFGGAVRLLADGAPPTAIVAGNAQILLGVMRALAERTLAIPGDVSLASLDDVPYLPFMAPPIASIVRDEHALGRAAAELMVKRLAGGAPETQVERTSFTPRGSIAAPANRRARTGHAQHSGP
jgi:LacI family transcriptional regulator